MTVAENAYAPSLTHFPVKGMLTGPITILELSFVRVDQLRNATAAQIALAVRDEVRDLVAVGPLSKLTSLPSRSPYPSSERYVQDKRRKERKEKKERKEERRRRKSRKNLVLSCLLCYLCRWEEYLDWASKSFGLATSGIDDSIHPHSLLTSFLLQL